MRIALGIAALLLAACASAADAPAVRAETLLQSSTAWDGTPYAAYPAGAPQLTMLKITIPPHTSLPWHTHPMPNAAYVLSGELIVEKQEGGDRRVLTPGQVLPELVGVRHRGTTGSEPVVLIVFYAGTAGMPLSEP